MAVFNEPTQWTHTLGNNADVVTLPDNTGAGTGLASLQKLFQQINQLPLSAGGIAPSRTDFNALFKILGDAVYYMMNGGVWSYNALFDYPVGAEVKYNNQSYLCIQANGPSTTVAAPTDKNYWARLIVESDITDLRIPVGTTCLSNSNNLPNNALWENGMEYDNADYPLLFADIGYRYGSTTAVKANCSLGEAFIAGAAGNNIRITVASSDSSFLVSTYESGELKDQQLVSAITDLLDTEYIIWDRTATLTDGTDVTMTGGADGTSFKVPNSKGKYFRIADSKYPLGFDVPEQLPNITGSISSEDQNYSLFNQGNALMTTTGAFSQETANIRYSNTDGSRDGAMQILLFSASTSNAVYTDNGLVLPQSISKQSFIIYK